ncbi:MmgE/PrpD family protein, partial [Escherichia coli]|uniref:MmgE/PrpD family protein n=1 Tax=Escherichia coli TaxID=562 RepID=UPI0011BAA01D
LSSAAIEKAKLFWYDSLGCGLGGSQQEDAHILLEHYKTMGGSGLCTCFVSGFKTNPVDAAFINDHMIR